MSQTTIYISGLEGRLQRERVRVPGPGVTLKAILEKFCQDKKLGDPANFYFVAFVAICCHRHFSHAYFSPPPPNTTEQPAGESP